LYYLGHMLLHQSVDISENDILEYDKNLLELLICDHTTGHNILWASESYKDLGEGYHPTDEITVERITGLAGRVIRPRKDKSKGEQRSRSRDNAEVFTPLWICNEQNNLVDDAWFGRKGAFNSVKNDGTIVQARKVIFPTVDGKGWFDYVKDIRLEITCGEAPYLTTRYDTAVGEYIEPSKRVGFADRKLKVIRQNTKTAKEFHTYAVEAFKSIYGYEWQGDNVLLARENLLFSYWDNFYSIKQDAPGKDKMEEIAEILSWNIWQMDGISYGIPGYQPADCGIFQPEDVRQQFCKIMDWEKGEEIEFRKIINAQ